MQLCYIFFFIIIWLLNYSYKKQLFEYSLDVIVNIIETRTEVSIWIWTLIADLGSGKLYGYLFIAILSWYGPVKGYNYRLVLTICALTMTTQKLIQHDPRPFMVDDRIEVMSCFHDYGNPSGHSVLAATFSTYLFLMHFHTERKQMISFRDKVKDWKYILGILGIIGYTFIQSFNRLFLGVHAIDQILFGCQLGFWVVFYYHYNIRVNVLVHLKKLIKQNPFENYQINYLQYALRGLLLFTIGFGIQFAAFLFAYYTFETPKDWIIRLAGKCSAPPLYNTFEFVNLYYSGATASGFGGYLGLLFRARYFPNSCNIFKNWKYFLVRAVMIFVIQMPFDYIEKAVPWDVPQYWMMIVFKALLPNFISSFLVFSLPDQIIFKVNKYFGWEQREPQDLDDSVSFLVQNMLTKEQKQDRDY
eukprot:403350595